MLHTLLALADGDKHGYAIIKEIDRRTDGAVRLSAGTLYALVKRALASGFIAEIEDRPDRRSTTNGAGIRLTAGADASQKPRSPEWKRSLKWPGRKSFGGVPPEELS